MANPHAEVEYRVRPVTRYVVTCWRNGQPEGPGVLRGVQERGEYNNAGTAYEVAYALCKAEHERLGYPLDDARVQYPQHPDHANATPCLMSAGTLHTL